MAKGTRSKKSQTPKFRLILIVIIAIFLFGYPVAKFLGVSLISKFQALASFVPIDITDTFEDPSTLSLNWSTAGVNKSTATIQSGQLLLTVPQGEGFRGISASNIGKSITATPLFNSRIPIFMGDFVVTVDFVSLDVSKSSAWQQLAFGHVAVVRRVSSGTSESLEVWTQADYVNGTDVDTKVTSLPLNPKPGTIKIRMTRVGAAINIYYNVGSGEQLLTTITDTPRLTDGEVFSLTTRNAQSKFPSLKGYFDNFSAQGQITQ